MWEIGALAPRGETLREVALPYMSDLYEATRENVHLAVLRDSEVLYVEKFFGRRSIRIPTQVGDRLPLHSTGAGKVLLAFSPPRLQDQVLRGGLQRFTSYTIIRPGTLGRVLDDVRRTGLATCVEELTPGAYSVAAPILDARRRTVAALSLVVRSAPGATDRIGPAVRTAAHGISRVLAQSDVRD
jgi:DNA-binding IclR family transcriptional regulator